MLKINSKTIVSHDFDGFSVKVFLDNDNQYMAHFIELPNISASANTFDGALDELKNAWELAKEAYLKYNIPIPVAPAATKNNSKLHKHSTHAFA